MTRCDGRHYVWLLLLGTAGTGAKGTVLPVLICGLGLWTLWRWWRERWLPVRPVIFAACLSVAFLVVYVPTMSAWRTGDAAWRPFHVFQVTSFWKQYLPAWQQWFAHWIPSTVATPLASLGCAAVIFAGTCGVRLLTIPYLLWGDLSRRDSLLVGWIGAFFFASAGMGMLMELNSYGELYVILMMRLPMAVLTAGFFVALVRRVARWWNEPRTAEPRRWISFHAVEAWIGGRALWLRRIAACSGVAVLIVMLGVQTTLWWTRNRPGFTQWLQTPTDLKPDAYMEELREALLWVRGNTEPNAVLVANACTPENMKKDHWGALDRTLMGVHFYYSALSERRMWFEGPNYVLDTTRERLRASLASNFFYRHRPLPSKTVSDAPSYVLLDHSLADGAEVSLPLGSRVFSNSRMDVYRLSEPESAAVVLNGTKVAEGAGFEE